MGFPDDADFLGERLERLGAPIPGSTGGRFAAVSTWGGTFGHGGDPVVLAPRLRRKRSERRWVFRLYLRY